MKRSFMIMLSIFLLAACGNNEPTTEYPSTIDGSNKGDKEQLSTQQNGEEEQPSTQSNDEEEVSEESEVTPQISDANNDHLNNYEELPILSTHIDLNAYTGTVETDNKGKRIIIFANNDGQKEYKSIFLKHDKRLKIITFNEDSPLYNDVIQ